MSVKMSNNITQLSTVWQIIHMSDQEIVYPFNAINFSLYFFLYRTLALLILGVLVGIIAILSTITVFTAQTVKRKRAQRRRSKS